ncbi:MAG: ribonuclease P protein component, partial [Gammaproteobacteria bacterium]
GVQTNSYRISDSDFSFRRHNKLLQQAEYRAVFSSGAKVATKLFRGYVLAGDPEHARLGLAVSKKACRHAVGRNRIKRQVREHFRQHKDQLVGYDWVILAQPLAASKTRRQLRGDIALVFEKLLSKASKLKA